MERERVEINLFCKKGCDFLEEGGDCCQEYLMGERLCGAAVGEVRRRMSEEGGEIMEISGTSVGVIEYYKNVAESGQEKKIWKKVGEIREGVLTVNVERGDSKIAA